MNPLLMSLILVAGLALSGWSLVRRLAPLKAMQPEVRWDRPGLRLARVAKYALGQRRFFSSFERLHGVAHMFIFWGFVVLGLNTINLVGRGFAPGWTLPGLGGSVFGLIKDVMVLVVLAGCLIALCRRLFVRPGRLTLSWEANLILVWIGLMMILEMIYSAAGPLAAPGMGEGASFLALAWRDGLISLGVTQDSSAARVLSALGFWGHVILVVAFLNYLPYGKHFHVLTSLPQVFFASLKPKGNLVKTDLTNPQSVFGVTTLQDYSWKRAWDMYSCTECGRCEALCPAHLSGKPLSPKRLMTDQRAVLKSLSARPPGEEAAKGESFISDEALWACTTCGQCREACPILVEHVDHLIDLRRGRIMVRGKMPREAVSVFKAWENMSNPWGLAANTRGDWLPAEGAPGPADRPDFEYLLYLGCAACFDDRGRKAAKALIKLLNRTGVSYACLGNEEKCCGETLRRLGNEYLAQMMMQANVDHWRKLGVKKILTACPHCFNSIANEYPDFGGEFEVIHHSRLLLELVEGGRLKPDGSLIPERQVTYHDSCYLGRYNGLYGEPRALLTSLGLELIEPDRTGKLALCCGAGGGRMWLEEDKDQRVNLLRSGQLEASGAGIWATACPYCRIMLDDAVLENKLGEKVKVLDLAQLLAAGLPD